MKRPLRRKKQVGLYLGPIKPSLFQVLYYDFLFKVLYYDFLFKVLYYDFLFKVLYYDFFFKVLYYDFLERFFGVQDRVESFPRYLPIPP